MCELFPTDGSLFVPEPFPTSRTSPRRQIREGASTGSAAARRSWTGPVRSLARSAVAAGAGLVPPPGSLRSRQPSRAAGGTGGGVATRAVSAAGTVSGTEVGSVSALGSGAFRDCRRGLAPRRRQRLRHARCRPERRADLHGRRERRQDRRARGEAGGGDTLEPVLRRQMLYPLSYRRMPSGVPSDWSRTADPDAHSEIRSSPAFAAPLRRCADPVGVPEFSDVGRGAARVC